ncbi:uncharacterized protein LOC125185567 [Salvia hispanica]|uniref:uncharacterized protein LOC125185567 n=1 Tax=Salvia hispanica TaxID=49212 RepID=UPI0020096D93|nr:uncharacterized protein LOC125185567 [Salvia hispanica]
MEHESFTHMFHEHPLSLIPYSSQNRFYEYWCYGCWRNILPGDATYGCSRGCGSLTLFHKECMEMPREIVHPIHPSHPLTLHDSRYGLQMCAVCEGYVYGLGYRCSQGGCDGLCIHMGCADDVLNDKKEKEPIMKHPSHPHELRFSKKTRWCPFPCDACGATEKGDSYTCIVCDYCIHESCALLPLSKDFPHHQHALSLAFSPPREYIQYEFDCGICSTTLPLRRWVYHCPLCRYVVHLNCATSTLVDNDNGDANAIDGDEKEATKFPIAVEDMYEEMIRPFVKRQKEQILIRHNDCDNHNISGKYSFSNHPHHLLTFTTFSSASSSSSSSHDHYKRDEDGFENIPRWELICDGCMLPIHEKKQTNDGDGYETGYMSCDECKYFLHLSCFNLPLEIPSLPIHPLKDHSLMLRSAGKLTHWIQCGVCDNCSTNGLYYSCTYEDCGFNIDIKCASLPNIIKHAAHPRHNYLKLVTKVNIYEFVFCVNCHRNKFSRKAHFKCNSCRISVCGDCVMLPAKNNHRLENHLLSLTYDTCVNRPGEFYCSSCERHMDPRSWMYHCRDCDQSFHPDCFPATSGWYRNIKFGTEHVISSIHDHPLRFQIITNKKRCDQCHEDSYDKPGFQCGSCFFVMCKYCGLKHMADVNADEAI